ncbi:FAD-dependent oxidoreductase [Paracoccus saliphilus]|uniref:FAD-dependent oxidoreductase n=1 Tax=Paracoccus saliphilus TaxID=405559 RepID=A0AA46A6H8_9RHOB|nr:FAD-dependent oxidoreductase [Paracoccus saliphilus]WCR01631.1 FAD-dependent oxidoreductase [Paracoccus saliphilus]SIS98558.1 FAD dependent oxidoreductase [Paracoccus saliphilus]
MARYRLLDGLGAQVPLLTSTGIENFLSSLGMDPGTDVPEIINPVTGSISPYVEEAETTALVEAFTVPPSARRIRTIDTCIKRLKATGIWAKLTNLHIVGATEQESLLNWKTPASAMSKIGAPTFSPDDGWQATGAGQALDSGLAPSDLAQDDVFHGVWCKGTDHNGITLQSDNLDYGAVDAAGNGISLCVRSASDSSTARTQGQEAMVAPAGHSDGYGLTAARRSVAAGSVGLRNGVAKPQASDVSAAPIAQSITLLAATVDGALSPDYSPHKQAAWAFGAALTETEARELTGAIGTFLDAIRYGEYDLTPAGLGPETVTVDVVIYGTTPQAVTAALQAARAGASVAIIGGWRDRHIGGMSASGLGWTDFRAMEFLTGIPRWIIRKARTMHGGSSSGIPFIPRMFSRVMRELLDPSTNGGYEIPVFYSDGVSSVSKNDTDITSMVTVDGRTVIGKQFIDASYEGDLLVAAGVPWRVGREMQGAGAENAGGYRGVATNYSSYSKQFQMTEGGYAYVDPWAIPGDTTSGLIPEVTGIYSEFSPDLHDQPPLGSADDELQAFNFRLAWGTDAARFVPLPTTPQPSWDPARFEMLFRHLVLDPLIRMHDLFKLDGISQGVYDINTGHGYSTDWVGMSKTYPGATYAEREAIWKAHWEHILNLFYALQHHDDPRVPSELRAEALTWGMRADHYHNHHENDAVFDTPQFYVREGVRMLGKAVMDARDLNQPDGEYPNLGTKTVAVASYPFDHHVMSIIAYEYEAGEWMTWMEGGFVRGQGGSNKANPVPFETYIPKETNCTNLSVLFATSLTTVAFGSVRMEVTAMQAGQSMGQAAAMAAAQEIAIQDVDYGNMRAALMNPAGPRLVDEDDPSLPQVT